ANCSWRLATVNRRKAESVVASGQVVWQYAGDAGAEARLIKVVKGGSNPAELHWKEVTGGMPMPANAHVADADVKTLVKWVLSQK
ncbi:MAG: hypothetical protein EBV35_08150, partial [Betaproteobacteria bacterium]|nr:hypothetical protein [Betaproteobacteria bacterium]